MKDQVDLGNLTSKEIGNLMTKPLVDRGKELAKIQNGNQEVDYGDLPSRALTSLGKQAVNDQIDQHQE
ncbi:hypothetical protein [Aminipila luticellarii]|uniref:Uncharacterized protein n=1 Tax=Aminipila luticellarii TaxID=2507160 RepID=A0A410PUR8_9FIRM|nr:hypothetical protein [Aminipila luticellarii]QAT42650.1 hypothetical protein EQM06_05095 [Aminipila luticellarii]